MIGEVDDQIATHVLNALTCALFVTDDTGYVQLINSAAETLLGGRRGLSLVGGKLTVRPDLAGVFGRLVVSAARRTGRQGGALRIPTEETFLQVLVTPLPGAQQAALVLIDDLHITTPPVHMLSQLYGLTPAEADIAIRLATGLSPAEVADEKTVSLATVRTHIQNLVTKMDARNLTDAIRILARIPGLKG